jgi:uncharacterized C2H2 Zn-finger protein
MQLIPKPDRIRPYVLPEEFDPNNYCSVCEKKFQDQNKYKKHLNLIHAMSLIEPKIVRPDLTPNKLDPNNYCCACEVTFQSKKSYQQHLIGMHAMSFGIIHPHIIPERHDPNNYCNAFTHTFYRTSLIPTIVVNRVRRRFYRDLLINFI